MCRGLEYQMKQIEFDPGFQVIQKEQISNFVILKDIQVGENVQNYLN